MSLATVTPIPQFALGIIASKTLDDAQFIPDLIGANVAAISHIYTNGANPLVAQYAQDHGIPNTVYPLTGGSNHLTSTGLIAEKVVKVYLIADGQSKSATQVEEVCKQKGVTCRRFGYEAAAHWREKVCKTAEILAGMTDEERKANPWAASAWKAIS